ncbi:MAG: sugar nucleotide-binding protein, partial [Candidatus Eisenbacteria bacterium]
YVFDGEDGPYTEDDTPSPINEYGRQKLECEEIVQTEITNFVIVRTTVVYGVEARKKNFVAKLIDALSKGDCVRVPSDQYGNPTYVWNVAEASVELARRRDTGIFNVVGATRIDRYGFAREAAREFGLSERLVAPVTTPELTQRAKRPLNAGLVTDKAGAVLKTRLLGTAEGLARMREEWERGHGKASAGSHAEASAVTAAR